MNISFSNIYNKTNHCSVPSSELANETSTVLSVTSSRNI